MTGRDQLQLSIVGGFGAVFRQCRPCVRLGRGHETHLRGLPAR